MQAFLPIQPFFQSDSGMGIRVAAMRLRRLAEAIDSGSRKDGMDAMRARRRQDEQRMKARTRRVMALWSRGLSDAPAQPTSHAAMSGDSAVQTGKRGMARAGAQRLHGPRFPHPSLSWGLVLTAKGRSPQRKRGAAPQRKERKFADTGRTPARAGLSPHGRDAAAWRLGARRHKAHSGAAGRALSPDEKLNLLRLFPHRIQALQAEGKILILFPPLRCGGGAWKPRQ